MFALLINLSNETNLESFKIITENNVCTFITKTYFYIPINIKIYFSYLKIKLFKTNLKLYRTTRHQVYF